MIVNPYIVEKKFKCNKYLAEYLIYFCGVPLLSVDGNKYYFTDNEQLQEYLDNLPFNIFILSFL